jgi:squalene synthase HpnC
MPLSARLIEDLRRHGPDAPQSEPLSLAESRRYCEKLALSHYENFTVATQILPKNLRPHFISIYAYCRQSDDLADELDDARESLRLLDWWQNQLELAYSGKATHPILIALAETIGQFDIPPEPFTDLLTAFRQDQTVTRYATFDDLLGYCRNSANPVGRLILYLGRCTDESRTALSDSICTALQLANFWQDVAEDFGRGRIYLPEEDRRRFGYDEKSFERHEMNEQFRQLLRFEVDRAEKYLRDGLPLVEKLPRELRLPVALFAAGGLAILDEIRRVQYDVWTARPTISKWQKLKLFAKTWLRLLSVE